MKKNAFTLIELLVVIAIISLLAGTGVIAYNSARTQTRDNKRLSDIMTIQNALELYKQQEGVYPASLNFGEALISEGILASTTYLSQIPTAPLPADGDCTDTTNTFYYYPSTDLNSYTLSWCSGKNVGNLAAGQKCTNPTNTTNCVINACDGVDFSCGGSCSYAGNLYNTVQIDSQCWFKENVNTGTRINSCASGACTGSNCAQTCSTRGTTNNNQTDADAGSFEKYCYNDDEVNCNTYGGLYQWHTVVGLAQTCDINDYNCTSDLCTITGKPECDLDISTDIQGICPSGWHVPSVGDYATTTDFLGGGSVAGDALKSAGTTYWKTPNSASNSSDWSALGSGRRTADGYYRFLKDNTYFWKDQPSLNSSYVLNLYNSSAGANNTYLTDRAHGVSLRCVQNAVPATPAVDCTVLASCGNNCSYAGKTYRTVQIDSQCWFKENVNTGTRINSCASGACTGSNCAQTCSTRGTTNNNQTDADAGSFEKYCYNDDEVNCNTYGGLYQWHTVVGLAQTCDINDYNCTSDLCTITGKPECDLDISTDIQGICPSGWHVPSVGDYSSMTSYLGGGMVAGGRLKQSGTSYWLDPNNADNSSNWSALGSGRMLDGQYRFQKSDTYFWKVQPSLSASYVLNMWNSSASANNTYLNGRSWAVAFRCIQN